jgi:hypothetical protein
LWLGVPFDHYCLGLLKKAKRNISPGFDAHKNPSDQNKKPPDWFFASVNHQNGFLMVSIKEGGALLFFSEQNHQLWYEKVPVHQPLRPILPLPTEFKNNNNPNLPECCMVEWDAIRHGAEKNTNQQPKKITLFLIRIPHFDF